MQPSTPNGRIWFFLIVLVIFGRCAFAQSSSNDPFTQADENINRIYKQALARFAPQNKEILRKAERAWIDFSNKQEALLNALNRENLLSQEAVDKATISEVEARTNHIEAFFCRQNVLTSPPTALQEQDQYLGKTYTECMNRLSNNAQRLLKEAERAWIAYRDADSAAVMMAYGNQSVQFASATHLTSIQSAHLSVIMSSMGQTSTARENSFPPIQFPSKTDDDVKEFADQKAKAKDLLTAFLAKKDDLFFHPADSINKAPELSPDMADDVSRLNSKFSGFSGSGKNSTLLQSGANEIAAIGLLYSWSKFTKALKSGSVEDADFCIEKMLGVTAKDAPAEYAPIWKAVDAWGHLYKKVAPDFLEHYRKARSFGNAGKISDAAREYQAAFEIIQNSTIPEQIKKLRQQSLGL